jgi:hypothetical protein
MDDERFYELIRRVLRHARTAIEAGNKRYGGRWFRDEEITYDATEFLERAPQIEHELRTREIAVAVAKHDKSLAIKGPT